MTVRRRRRRDRALAAVLAATAGLAGVSGACASDDDTVVVFAPSSLAPLQGDLDAALRAQGLVPPEWVFAGSQTLVSQLRDGAPADVVITADARSFEEARTAATLADDGAPIASNTLVLAVAPGNPGQVSGIDDLADPERIVGVCALAVPCGRLTDRALTALGRTVTADTEESSARALLAKLRAGEIDAALVYRSDARAARLTVVPVNGLDAFENNYWAAQLEGSQAGGLLDFLRSPDGHRVFADAGLLAPTTPGARS